LQRKIRPWLKKNTKLSSTPLYTQFQNASYLRAYELKHKTSTELQKIADDIHKNAA